MLALILPMVLALYFFSEFFITITFGKDYLEAADILKVTVLYSLIIPFNRQFGTVMDGLKKPQINFYLLVLAAVINVALNYMGIKYYGLIGCAYATLISYCLLFAMNQIILYRNYKINAFASLLSVGDWYRRGWNFLTTRLLKAFRFVWLLF
jgi:O-antigen/teichoic acid export membrane protein